MIKEAKISDYDIIAQIDKDSNKNKLENEQLNNIREALTNYSKVVFIDYENEIPVAYAQCSLQDENISPIGYLEKISIKRNYQNKGIAKKLLNKCEDWAKDRGCEKFTASCNIDDEQAMNLYNYSGFSEISKVAYFSKELNV